MESIIVACITGVVTLIGVILSNSKNRAVISAISRRARRSWSVMLRRGSSSHAAIWRLAFASLGSATCFAPAYSTT